MQAESRARLSSEGYDEQGYRVEGGLADVQANLYKSIGRQHDILESNAELKNKQQAQEIQVLTAQTHQLQKDQILYLSDKALTETIAPLTQNGNIDPAPMNLLLRSNNKVREVFLQKFGISGFTEFIPCNSAVIIIYSLIYITSSSWMSATTRSLSIRLLWINSIICP